MRALCLVMSPPPLTVIGIDCNSCEAVDRQRSRHDMHTVGDMPTLASDATVGRHDAPLVQTKHPEHVDVHRQMLAHLLNQGGDVRPGNGIALRATMWRALNPKR